jgi:hypothetical protein
MYILLSVSKAVFDLNWRTNSEINSSFEENGFLDLELFYEKCWIYITLKINMFFVKSKSLTILMEKHLA